MNHQQRTSPSARLAARMAFNGLATALLMIAVPWGLGAGGGFDTGTLMAVGPPSFFLTLLPLYFERPSWRPPLLTAGMVACVLALVFAGFLFGLESGPHADAFGQWLAAILGLSAAGGLALAFSAYSRHLGSDAS